MAAALAALVGALAMFGGETRAVIALAVFDQTEGLLDQADAPTLLTDVLGVSERYQGPVGHAGTTGHGSIGYYELKLATDPNKTGADLTTNSVKVTISVDDLSVDGMSFDGGTVSAATDEGRTKARKVLGLCVASSNSGPSTASCADGATWSDSVEIYFASSAGVTGAATGVIGKWDINQRVSIRAHNDDIDDVSSIGKRVQINHAYSNYANHAGPEKITVTVTDNDTRGINVVLPSDDGDTDTLNEGNTYLLPIKLDTRPQKGAVAVTLAVTPDASDIATEIEWYKPSSNSCESDINHASYGTGAVSWAFNDAASREWDTTQYLCIAAQEDSIEYATNETVQIVFTAADQSNTAKTDYGGAFVRAPTDGNDLTWWDRDAFPSVSPVVWAAPAVVTKTVTLTIDDNEAGLAGVVFTSSGGSAIDRSANNPVGISISE